MLLSLAIIFLMGSILGTLAERVGLPRLIGMLATGILIGPFVGNLLDPTISALSPDLRQIALIIILTRAGLSLDMKDLKKVGRSAVLMCFVPASFEIIGVMLLAPKLLEITLLQAAVLGTVVAAVSPAVVVPKMIGLMEKGYGTKKGIPQMVLAGASVDDVFVIVLFTAFTALLAGDSVQVTDFLSIPISIILGILVGSVTGYVLIKLFSHFHMRDTTKVGILLSSAFLLVSLEKALVGIVGFSGLLAVMALGIIINKQKNDVAKRLSLKFSKLWVGAEVLLFVLVGATVNIDYAIKAGIVAVVLVMGALGFRIAGVFTSVIGTNLTKQEKLFTAFAYMPKATVQAAIGGLPLAMGLPGGEIILTVAVVSIIVTAPIGAMLIDKTHKKLLTKEG